MVKFSVAWPRVRKMQNHALSHGSASKRSVIYPAVTMVSDELLKAIALSSFGLIWLGCLSLLSIWSTLRTCKQGVSHLKRLHQVPCHRCQYFTGDYRLKCTVQPSIACTEAAIDCTDFIPTSSTVLRPKSKLETHQNKEHFPTG